MSSRKKKALGRGLGALLGNSGSTGGNASVLEESAETTSTEEAGKVIDVNEDDVKIEAHGLGSGNQHPNMLPISKIRPNPQQPRRHFDEDKLQELADSISEHGVLQPLLVCPDPQNSEGYLLLAGERRWRASKRVGIEEVPVRIVEASEEEQLEFALIENIQRDDLNPVEEAKAYQELINGFDYSQDQVAKRVGKSRVAVANALRLLKLSDYALRDLEEGTLSPGHARAILMVPHPLQREEFRQEIIDQGLTVRESEARAKQYASGEISSVPGESKPKKSTPSEQQNLDVQHAQEKIMEVLGCPVRIKTRTGTKGKIEITFQNLDDFDRINERLGIEQGDI